MPVLSNFFAFSASRGVAVVDAIDPDLVRDYLIDVGKDHTASTVHWHYRVIKTWLRWYEDETAPDRLAQPGPARESAQGP